MNCEVKSTVMSEGGRVSIYFATAPVHSPCPPCPRSWFYKLGRAGSVGNMKGGENVLDLIIECEEWADEGTCVYDH